MEYNLFSIEYILKDNCRSLIHSKAPSEVITTTLTFLPSTVANIPNDLHLLPYILDACMFIHTLVFTHIPVEYHEVVCEEREGEWKRREFIFLLNINFGFINILQVPPEHE